MYINNILLPGENYIILVLASLIYEHVSNLSILLHRYHSKLKHLRNQSICYKNKIVLGNVIVNNKNEKKSAL